MANTTEIILKEGSFIRRTIQEVNLGSQDSVLARCAVAPNVMLKNIIPLGTHGISLLVGQQDLVMITQLDKLPFKTYFELNHLDAAILSPTYRPHRGTLLIDDPWPVPDSLGKVLFALRFNKSLNNFLPVNAYMWLYKDLELYRLPYPNIYGDGRICMGHAWDENRTKGKGIMDDFLHALATFQSTQMSEHLTSGTEYIFYRRSLENKWLPPPTVNFSTATVPFMEGFNL